MDPELKRALIIVTIVGSLMGGIGATVLYFVFRAYGGQKPGGSAHFGLIAALVSFVLACALLLFTFSRGVY